MAKHHFIPRLIIKRFADPSGKILYYSKKNNSVSKPIPHYDQLQEGNFYSKKLLSALKKDFDHIIINPLFKDVEKPLEKNLDINVESPMGAILERIIQPVLDGKSVKLSQAESDFIKKYIEIQHVRTVKFKEIGKEVHKVSLNVPDDIGKIIMNQEHKREPDIKKIIKERSKGMDSEARRKMAMWKLKLKKNPNLLNDIRNSDSIRNVLETEINKMEEKFEFFRNSPDKHSSEVIDSSLTDRFLKSRGLDKNHLRFVLNNTLIPFVLTDTGMIIMCWDYGDRQELRVYLPIHPKILIELCPEESLFIADEDYVKEFNQISKSESLLNTYSNSEEALKLLVK
ncbi:MAG: DUF4238 domain-containing protein [Nanoarchaeota archaeon]